MDQALSQQATGQKKSPAENGAQDKKDLKTPEKPKATEATSSAQSNSTYTPTCSFQKKQRIAHVPKFNNSVIPEKRQEPEPKKSLQKSSASPNLKNYVIPKKYPESEPKPQPKKRISTTPQKTAITPKRPKYNLDALLTPPEVVVLSENEIAFDPFDAILKTILNWDPAKLLDSKYQQEAFQKLIVHMPTMKYTDVTHYEKCVPSIFCRKVSGAFSLSLSLYKTLPLIFYVENCRV